MFSFTIYLSMCLMIKYTCLREIAFVLVTGTDQVGHESGDRRLLLGVKLTK